MVEYNPYNIRTNTIYCLRNKINDKVYIGQTWQSIKKRFQNGYYGCKHIKNALDAYGKKNFYYEILNICYTQEEADELERFWIKKFNSSDRKYGYNLSSGGKASGTPSIETRQKISDSNKGKIITEKTRQKLINSHLGFVHSEETRKKLSIINKGKKLSKEHVEKIANSNRGRKNSEESKKKMSESAKKKPPMTQETKNKLAKIAIKIRKNETDEQKRIRNEKMIATKKAKKLK